MYPLISPSQVESLARPCYSDVATIEKAIEEATLVDIAPLLGAATFELVKELPGDDALFIGATYESDCGEIHSSAGLLKALAYFTWARLVKTSPMRLTRYGFVEKRTDNSTPVSWEERQAAYNDAFAIAQQIMGGVLGYIRANEALFPDFDRGCCKTTSKSGRVRVTSIGK